MPSVSSSRATRAARSCSCRRKVHHGLSGGDPVECPSRSRDRPRVTWLRARTQEHSVGDALAFRPASEFTIPLATSRVPGPTGVRRLLRETSSHDDVGALIDPGCPTAVAIGDVSGVELVADPLGTGTPTRQRAGFRSSPEALTLTGSCKTLASPWRSSSERRPDRARAGGCVRPESAHEPRSS